jgi:hypothetical protein
LLKSTAFARPSKPAIKSKYVHAAEAAYRKAGTVGTIPEGYELARETDTLKFYRSKSNPNDVLVGVRGSKDSRDWRANALLALGQLKTSKRYKEDKSVVDQFLRENPSATLEVSGHSLGGAVARELTRDFRGRIRGGTGYNSAIGLNEIINPSLLTKTPQNRYSTRTDPLRLLSLPFLSGKLAGEVVDKRLNLDLLGAHKIEKNFDATGAGV